MATSSRPIRVPLSGGGSVGGLLVTPAKRAPIGFVLAHGAGGDQRAPLLEVMAAGLGAAGFSVLRFDFPYRDAGKKVPDPPAKLESCIRDAAARLRETGVRRIVLGGKSMGGRMATHVAAAGEPCVGVLLLGYPLHPAGKPSQLRDAHLAAVPVPMLFLQGTRDPLCDLALLRPVLHRIGPRATLHVVEGGDHSLDVRGRARADVHAELIERVVTWARALSPSTRARSGARRLPRAAKGGGTDAVVGSSDGDGDDAGGVIRGGGRKGGFG